MGPATKKFEPSSNIRTGDASPKLLSHVGEFDHLSKGPDCEGINDDLYRTFGPRVTEDSLFRRCDPWEFLNSSNDISESRTLIAVPVDTEVMKDRKLSRRAQSLRSRNVLLNNLLGPVPEENNNFVSKEDTSRYIRDNEATTMTKHISVVDDVIESQKIKVNILKIDHHANTSKIPLTKKSQKGKDGLAIVDLLKVREKLENEYFPSSSVLEAAAAGNRRNSAASSFLQMPTFSGNSGANSRRAFFSENDEPPVPIFRRFNPNEAPLEPSFNIKSSDFPPLNVRPR